MKKSGPTASGGRRVPGPSAAPAQEPARPPRSGMMDSDPWEEELQAAEAEPEVDVTTEDKQMKNCLVQDGRPSSTLARWWSGARMTSGSSASCSALPGKVPQRCNAKYNRN